MKLSTAQSNYQLGLGSSSGNYFAIQPDSSKIKVYANGGSSTSSTNVPSTSNEIIYELVDSGTAKLYVDTTLVGTYAPNSNVNRYVKAVDYQNLAYDVSYIKIKPL